jgi:predicted RNA binding protein YcfA (HicA-like mRNA interferase family)
MVSELPTRKVTKMLRQAGWEPVRTVGSHTLWRSAGGNRTLTVPDGHRSISPGVVRQILKALEEDPQ